MSTINAADVKFVKPFKLNNLAIQALIIYLPITAYFAGFFMGGVGVVLMFIAGIIAFVADRSDLKSQGAFVPHALWYFFLAVYLWQRQKNNHASLSWFWAYLVITFSTFVINTLVLQALRSGY